MIQRGQSSNFICKPVLVLIHCHLRSNSSILKLQLFNLLGLPMSIPVWATSTGSKHDFCFCSLDLTLVSGVPVDQLCQHSGHCLNVGSTHHCQCQVGYTGSYCEVQLDECDSSPCQNGATCRDHLGGYQCEVTPGISWEEGSVLRAQWYREIRRNQKHVQVVKYLQTGGKRSLHLEGIFDLAVQKQCSWEVLKTELRGVIGRNCGWWAFELFVSLERGGSYLERLFAWGVVYIKIFVKCIQGILYFPCWMGKVSLASQGGKCSPLLSAS